MNRIHSILIYLAAAVMTVAVVACSSTGAKKEDNTAESSIVTVMCDNSFENILQQEVDVYEYVYSDANVIPYYLSETEAIDSLLSLKTRLAVISRPLTQDETDYLAGHKRTPRVQKIAVDAIALIVNPENTIEILSCKEISEILSGEVTRWDELEPSKMGNINVVFDDAGSSTVKYMRDSLLRGKEFGPNVYAQGSNRAVFEAVKASKNTIGVIGVSWISTDLKGVSSKIEDRARAAASSDTTSIGFDPAVKVLKVRPDNSIEAYKPYQYYIYTGQYTLFRSMYMVCASVSGTDAHKFFSFVTGFQGQKIIQMTGILPATIQPRMVSLY